MPLAINWFRAAMSAESQTLPAKEFPTADAAREILRGVEMRGITLHWFQSPGTQAVTLIALNGIGGKKPQWEMFADDHINQVIEQKLITNTKLRLIVVAPDAEKKIAATPFLGTRSRVFYLKKGAKDALNDGDIDRMCRKLQRESGAESPF
jgi:hypothetical protein